MDFLTKSDLQSANSNLTLTEINSSLGRCFSFEVVIPLTMISLFTFEINMTQIDVLWCYVHDKYDRLGFYNNYWMK